MKTENSQPDSESTPIVLRIRNAGDEREIVTLFDQKELKGEYSNSKMVHIFPLKVGKTDPPSYEQVLKQFSVKEWELHLVRVDLHRTKTKTIFSYKVICQEGDVTSEAPKHITMDAYQSQSGVVIKNFAGDNSSDKINSKVKWEFYLEPDGWIDILIYPKTILEKEK